MTQGDIEAGMRAIGVQASDTCLVHTSLSAFGWVNGGAMTVIAALKSALTAQGTIVMPALSADCSDPARWSNPPVPEAWWPRIRETMPAYDPDRTPTTKLGCMPEVFRGDPEVKRSGHPQVSFTAWGAQTDVIVEDHQLEHGLGDGSPLKKLYDCNARVLFLGTSYATCTAFHLGEWRAGVRPKIQQGAPMMVNGERQWVSFEETDYDEAPFADIGTDFEEETDVSQTKVGWATLRLFSLREAVDFAERVLRQEQS